MTWNIHWIITSSTNSDNFPFFPTNSFSFLNCVGSYTESCKPHRVLFFCSFSLWVCSWVTELIFSDLSFTKFSNVSHYFFFSCSLLYSQSYQLAVFLIVLLQWYFHMNIGPELLIRELVEPSVQSPIYISSSTWDRKSNLRKDSF